MPENRNREFVSIDLETSGFDPRFAEIIEVGAVRFTAAGDVLSELDMLVKPTGDVPESILRLTGISRGELELAPSWEEVRLKVQEFVDGAALVGQSINFDMDFLRFGGVKLSGEWYDTWFLTTALFPGLEAYSLEALSEEFGIDLDDAHRAVSDCHAARKLFLYDCWALNALNESVKEELMEISQKSVYAIGKLIADLPAGSQPPELSPKGHASRGAARDLSEALTGLAGDKILLNLPPGTDLAESLAVSLSLKTPRSIVALASRDDQQYLLERLEEAGVHAAVILDQSSVISEGRLQNFLGQKRFSLTEAILASKLIIWLATTERGARNELSLAGEESGLWKEISCGGLAPEDLKEESYWRRHLEEIAGAHQLLTTFRGLSEEHLPDGEPLIIADFQLFDELMTSHLSSRVFSDTRAGEEEGSQSSLDIVWGLLGMLVRNYAKEGGNSLRISDKIRETHEWSQLEDALANTRERAKDDSRSGFVASQLIDVLGSGAEWVVWIESDGERVSVHRSPLSLDPLLLRLGEDRGCLLVSAGESAPPEGFETVSRSREDQHQTVTVLEDSPAPNNPNASEYLRQLLQRLIQTEPDRRIYIAFSSKSSAAEFAGICGDEISGRALIGEGVNGNLNRTRLIFRRDKRQIVLGSLRSNRQGFLNCEFDTIIVPKLSFDPPGIPIHEARGARQGGFGGYTVPRVSQKVRQLLSKLDPSGRGELILADGRLHSARYGKDLLDRLGLDIEAATLDQLQ